MSQKTEQDHIPYHAQKSVPKGDALVFAPHPDDEVFGCGGAIIRHLQQNDKVKVVIVTDGGFPVHESQQIADYPIIRKRESAAAAEILGYRQPEFLDYPDGFLVADEKLITHLLEIIEHFQPQNIYLPGKTEIHPDHLALYNGGVQAAIRYKAEVKLCFYEVGQALKPTFFHDISDIQAVLEKAMDCFKSQLKVQDYKRHITALHAYRSYTLGNEVKFAEAYHIVNSQTLKPGDVLWKQDFKRFHQPKPENISSVEFPLISVIVRTMNRPELPEALESIANQTYPNLEVIVVDAKGDGDLNLGDLCGNFPIRLITKKEALNRPEAANAGLEAVKGEYFCFLDEDDIFLPGHIHDLYLVLKESDAPAAYSAIERVDKYFNKELLFNYTFSFIKLLHDNYIPNLALLFRTEIIEQGCKFDPTLAIYEDWDFLLQAAQRGDFLFVDFVGGYYRNLQSSDIYNNKVRALSYRKKVLSKWITLISDEQFNLLIPIHSKDSSPQKIKSNDPSGNAELFYTEKNSKITPYSATADFFKKRFSIQFLEQHAKKIYAFIRTKKTYYRNIHEIKRSGLFDKIYYLNYNPDVKDAGMSPIVHYLLFGGFEGRNPSADFDSAFYLEQNQDVKNAGLNPLLHYIKFGKKEQRSYSGSFDNWRGTFSAQWENEKSLLPLQQSLDHFTLSFLIIAETRLPQCNKYRVVQKVEMLEYLEYKCDVVDWREAKSAISFLQTTKVAIFYRVPAVNHVLGLLREADNLGVKCYFEVDDLIFNGELYKANLDLLNLNEEFLNQLLDGAGLYNKTLKACNNSIGSTHELAMYLKAEIEGDIHIIENCIDKESITIAANIQSKKNEGKIVIAYGSGTSTHNADFQVAAPALIRLLKENKNVLLYLFGDIIISDEFSELPGQIKQLPLMAYGDYLNQLSQADICISPLVVNAFNNSKSNIKFLEASLLKIPCVSSPCSAFKTSINHGDNGYLASTEKDWYDILKLLVNSKKLRKNTGASAYNYVIKNYHYQAIAKNQVLPFCKQFQSPYQPAKKVLVVNLFFYPNSFGGATIVAEEMTNYMSEHDIMPAVFTSAYQNEIGKNEFVRTSYNGIPEFRVALEPSEINARDYINERIHKYFIRTIHTFKPDIVHFHAIQGFGAGIAEICRSEKVPYVITLHDMWWLCERQFMFNREGKYCGQNKIEAEKCAQCIEDVAFNQKRTSYLKDVLMSAEKLLAPSEYIYQLYKTNGISKSKLLVNENGIKTPDNAHPNYIKSNTVCFGFVAGNESLKGYDLIKEVFEKLESSKWKLLIVDHKSHNRNLGFSSIEINGKGSLEVIPKYTEQTMDRYFDSIDVLLFPTQIPEPFGLTVREALVRNKWVIATDTGGISEAIQNGINGTLIPFSSNPVYLKDAVEDILKNPTKLNGWINPMAKNIRTFEGQAKELVEIFSKLTWNKMDNNLENNQQ